MASGFFALLDDISMLMDDVATMSKVATKKTAGILGDDLAVNAEKASGFQTSREIPVLWAITKGSFLNKLIILPIAFLLSAFYPTAIIYILLIGGVYLAYEGTEKIYESLVSNRLKIKKEKLKKITKNTLLLQEKKKIKSAIITDFILSIEIVILALSTVIDESLLVQVMVVTFIATIATIGVYGVVALIVRMDDLGYSIIRKSKNKKQLSYKLGIFLVNALPKVIKMLAIVGTIAMILVAGGIFTHNLYFLNTLTERLPSILSNFIVGFIVGFISLFFFLIFKKIINLKLKNI